LIRMTVTARATKEKRLSFDVFVAQADSTEAFELPDVLFDADSCHVGQHYEVLWPVRGVLCVGGGGQGTYFLNGLVVFRAVMGAAGEGCVGSGVAVSEFGRRITAQGIS